MPPDTLINSVRSYLASQHMFVEDEWLIGCIEYLTEDTSTSYSEDEIRTLAKEQWLLNDLKDICPGSLPPNLQGLQKTVLEGRFMLQINSAIDIGTPAYQQYLKLQKINTENIEATTKFDDKIPSHRMIKLYMTDGVQEVSGIEYRPMRNLSCDITPGCKVLIKGPVECRRGVMLLTESAVELLGGEVQEIALSHSLAGLLAAKLGVEVTQGSALNTTVSHPRNTDIPTPHSTMPPRVDSSESIPFSEQSSTTRLSNPTVQSVNTAQNRLTTGHNKPNLAHSQTDLFTTERHTDQNRPTTANNDQNRPTTANNDQNRPTTANNDQNRPTTAHNRPVNEYMRPIARVTSLQVANFADDDIDIDQIAEIEAQYNPTTSKRSLPDSTPKPDKRIKIDNSNTEDDYPNDADLFFEDDEYLKEMEANFDAKERLATQKIPEIVSSEPYVYIKQIKELAESKKMGRVFKVRGQIIKLLSKLSVGKDGWSLKCTIIDGTGNIDVEFTSGVLSKLVGYTPQEMNQLKKEMVKKPELKKQAVSALEKARDALQVLNCIIELTMLEVPKITNLILLEQVHIDYLKARTDSVP